MSRQYQGIIDLTLEDEQTLLLSALPPPISTPPLIFNDAVTIDINDESKQMKRAFSQLTSSRPSTQNTSLPLLPETKCLNNPSSQTKTSSTMFSIEKPKLTTNFLIEDSKLPDRKLPLNSPLKLAKEQTKLMTNSSTTFTIKDNTPTSSWLPHSLVEDGKPPLNLSPTLAKKQTKLKLKSTPKFTIEVTMPSSNEIPTFFVEDENTPLNVSTILSKEQPKLTLKSLPTFTIGDATPYPNLIPSFLVEDSMPPLNSSQILRKEQTKSISKSSLAFTIEDTTSSPNLIPSFLVEDSMPPLTSSQILRKEETKPISKSYLAFTIEDTTPSPNLIPSFLVEDSKPPLNSSNILANRETKLTLKSSPTFIIEDSNPASTLKMPCNLDLPLTKPTEMCGEQVLPPNVSSRKPAVLNLNSIEEKLFPINPSISHKKRSDSFETLLQNYINNDFIAETNKKHTTTNSQNINCAVKDISVDKREDLNANVNRNNSSLNEYLKEITKGLHKVDTNITEKIDTKMNREKIQYEVCAAKMKKDQQKNKCSIIQKNRDEDYVDIITSKYIDKDLERNQLSNLDYMKILSNTFNEYGTTVTPIFNMTKNQMPNSVKVHTESSASSENLPTSIYTNQKKIQPKKLSPKNNKPRIDKFPIPIPQMRIPHQNSVISAAVEKECNSSKSYNEAITDLSNISFEKLLRLKEAITERLKIATALQIHEKNSSNKSNLLQNSALQMNPKRKQSKNTMTAKPKKRKPPKSPRQKSKKRQNELDQKHIACNHIQQCPHIPIAIGNTGLTDMYNSEAAATSSQINQNNPNSFCNHPRHEESSNSLNFQPKPQFNEILPSYCIGRSLTRPPSYFKNSSQKATDHVHNYGQRSELTRRRYHENAQRPPGISDVVPKITITTDASSDKTSSNTTVPRYEYYEASPKVAVEGQNGDPTPGSKKTKFNNNDSTLPHGDDEKTKLLGIYYRNHY